MREPKILIVEDDRNMRWLLQRQIEKFQVAVDFAISGEHALVKVRENNYQLVLMDVCMPGLDGLQVTRLIRTAERENHQDRLPIVGVTALSDRESCLQAGMDDFCPLPLSLDDVRKILDRWLARQRADV